MKIALVNTRLFNGDRFIFDSAVLADQEEIIDIVPVKEVPADYVLHDLGNKILAPAFIDLQIYGGNGKMFSHEPEPDSIAATKAYCNNGGAAYFMITMATNSLEKFMQGIKAVKQYWKQGGEGCLGLHLEGPFLNVAKKGAHIAKYIRRPTKNEIDILLKEGEGIIKMMTVAPEECDPSIIRELKQAGILVSAGHTDATYQQAMDAFDAGLPVATHLFNAMSPFLHRQPGMVGAILDHPLVKSSIVCDGIHVNYPAVRISHRIMQDRLFFITDAVTEVREGEYVHLLNGDRYTLPDGTLSGSSLTMLKCVYNAINYAGIPPEVALSMATSIPASLLEDSLMIGKIENGYESKFCVLDDTYETVELLELK